jgi:DNA-binding winged helix-turn-helix (wHTH) protein
MFGPFCLDISYVPLKGNKPVPVGSRALKILIALIDHPGELVEKDELVARAWRNRKADRAPRLPGFTAIHGISLATHPPV